MLARTGVKQDSNLAAGSAEKQLFDEYHLLSNLFGLYTNIYDVFLLQGHNTTSKSERKEKIWLLTYRRVQHYQLQTKDRKNNPVRKGVRRQEDRLHAEVCAGGQNTRINKSLFPDQPLAAE